MACPIAELSRLDRLDGADAVTVALIRDAQARGCLPQRVEGDFNPADLLRQLVAARRCAGEDVPTKPSRVPAVDPDALPTKAAAIRVALEDQVVRRIEAALLAAGGNGMTRMALRDHFSRNLSAVRITAALDLLRVNGRATVDAVLTGGRPSERWRLTTEVTTEGGATVA